MKNTSIRTPLARVRGLGSAKDGTSHWWAQRMTALALIPLGLWFVYSLMHLAVLGDSDAVAAWLQSPLSAIALIALLVALFWHARLGMQVIIEDYVHSEPVKMTLLIFNSFCMLGLGLISAVCVLKLHLLPIVP